MYQVDILKKYYQKFSPFFLKGHIEKLFSGQNPVFLVDDLVFYFKGQDIDISNYFESLPDSKEAKLNEFGAYFLLCHIDLLRHRKDRRGIAELLDPYFIVKADDIDKPSVLPTEVTSSSDVTADGKTVIIRGGVSPVQVHSVVLDLNRLIHSEDYQVSLNKGSEYSASDADLLDGFFIVE